VEPPNHTATKAAMSIPGQQGAGNLYVIHPATILAKRRESEDIDTYRLRSGGSQVFTSGWTS